MAPSVPGWTLFTILVLLLPSAACGDSDSLSRPTPAGVFRHVQRIRLEYPYDGASSGTSAASWEIFVADSVGIVRTGWGLFVLRDWTAPQ